MTPFWLVLTAAGVAATAAITLVLRSHRPPRRPRSRWNRARGNQHRRRPRLVPSALHGLQAALRALVTRTEWRYSVPWALALGEAGAGKTSIAASVTSGRRPNLLLRERKLVLPGTQWSFFDRGLLIDPGRAPGAPEREDTRWQRFLDRLERQRPERPLDAVVLHVSARSLLGGDAAALQALADHCYRQLWSLQKAFGFALPVYVVVTQCDAVAGFSAFWRSVGTPRNQLVGWSNPYPPGHAFSADRVDEAVVTIRNALAALQLAAASSEPPADADDCFLFPLHLEALREPLQAVLEPIFRESGYHAGFPCRGIYLAGSVVADGATARRPRNDVDFVDDLFAEKVFAEHHLAVPTRGGILSRNRAVRHLQVGGALAFAALVSLGVFDTWRLNQQLDNVARSLALLHGAERESRRTGGCPGHQSMHALLVHVARIDSSLVYPAIPASWVDHRVSERTARTIAENTFERIVFPSLACHLDRRHAALARHEATVEAEPDALRDTRQHERALLDYLDALLAYERNRDRFDALRMGASERELPRLLDELDRLTDYLYGVPLPAEVRQPHGSPLAALAHVTHGATRPAVPLRRSAGPRIEVLVRAAADAIRRHAAGGTTLVRRLEQASGDARDDLGALGRWLDWVHAGWIAPDDAAGACRALRTSARGRIEQLARGFGYPLDAEALLAPLGADACGEPARGALLATRLPPTGPILDAPGDGLALRPAARDARDGIARVFELPFMQLDAGAPFACEGPIRGWDPAAIAEAGRHLRAFRRLLDAGEPAPRVGDRPALHLLASARHLQGVVDAILREAVIPVSLARKPEAVHSFPGTEAEVRRASRALADTLDDLLFVLRQYQALGFEPSYGRIVQCARDFAHDALLDLDGLAARSRLYTPAANGVARPERGDGGGGDGAPLFDLGSRAATAAYLERQAERTRVLAGYAAPFVTLLDNTPVVRDGALLPGQSGTYWSRTISELNRHLRFKAPDSDLARLHRMIQEDVRPLTHANCAERVESLGVFAASHDLFARQGRQLERRARLYCSDHLRAVAFDAYQRLAQRFRHELAGAFPFAPLEAPDAAPARVRRFFRGLAEAPLPGREFATARALAGDDRFADFLDALEASADFFKLNLAAADAIRPVGVEARFRLRPELSRGNDQLVRWAVGTGTRASRFPNDEQPLDWRFGEPLSVSFLWAEGSELRPVDDARQPALHVEGARATFRVDGEWALLRMARRFAARGIPARDPLHLDRVRLEFTVPVARRDDPGRPVDEARLFLELHLSGGAPDPGETRPVVLPQRFPAGAPSGLDEASGPPAGE